MSCFFLNFTILHNAIAAAKKPCAENKSELNKKGSNSNGYRIKAVFVKRPNDPYDERIEELYKIRQYRLITKDDMEKIWKEWSIKV